ncbi:TPA: hypothetical protein NBM92_005719, partial [Klebsiella oxytoca]|nr:hypothetical protein [Klebsiella oxytoca]
EQSYYSLGRVNRNGNLGYFFVSVSNPIIDGKPGMVLRTGNKSNIDKTGKNLPIHSDYYYAASVDGKPNRSTTISFDLLVHPYLNKLTDTNGPLIDGAQLDGNVELLISHGN